VLGWGSFLDPHLWPPAQTLSGPCRPLRFDLDHARLPRQVVSVTAPDGAPATRRSCAWWGRLPVFRKLHKPPPHRLSPKHAKARRAGDPGVWAGHPP
jgi:hypothetical protein